MTNENLIDLACKWLEEHQSSYISHSVTDDHYFVNGGSLTDLRYFLEEVCKLNSDGYIFYEDVRLIGNK